MAKSKINTRQVEDFDYDANPNVPAALIHTLAKSAWVAAGQPCCLIGDSGTGKSHLLIGLGTAAAEAGYRVRYVTAAALVNELVEAADDKTLSRTIARYGRVDLLCLDELGYLELDRRGAELLFQVFTEREERASIAIASNAAFSKAHMFRRTCARSCRNPAGSAPDLMLAGEVASLMGRGVRLVRMRGLARRVFSRGALFLSLGGQVCCCNG